MSAHQQQRPEEAAAVEGAPETCEVVPCPPTTTTTTTTTAPAAAGTPATQTPAQATCCFPHVDPAAAAQRVKGGDDYAGTGGGKGYGAGEE